MRAIDSKLSGVSAEIDHEVDDYRAAVPAIRNAESIVFRKPVTMFIGENGSRKSTLAYEKTEHYTVMRDFFNHCATMLRERMA
ncbi:MAG TPA: hypothetical protein VGQ65_10455 [Thermoanaerobaculia bacterium]|nr:hypothetical protein [Thermoanaerobaculia bacterium]